MKNMKDKTICYCIGVKESTIVKAIQEGAHTVKAIQKATKACTGNQCKELNPKGRCCSGDITAIIKRETGRKSKCCCCIDDSHTAAFSWKTGEVDSSGEHIEIKYGDIDNPISVAFLSPPVKRVFTVQFLIEDNKGNKAILKSIKVELDFYLLEKGEPNPWVYMKHHCTSAGNMYSKVHWIYWKKGRTSTGSSHSDRRKKPLKKQG
jgi:bacterioferritin-associated ferredoxin